jgi:hypothetical protein
MINQKAIHRNKRLVKEKSIIVNVQVFYRQAAEVYFSGTHTLLDLLLLVLSVFIVA